MMNKITNTGLTVCFVLLFRCARAGELPATDVLVDLYTDRQDTTMDLPEMINDAPPEMLDIPPPDTSAEPVVDVTPPETTETTDIIDMAPPDIVEVVDIIDTRSEDAGVEDIYIDPGPGTCSPSDFPNQTMCNPGFKCTFGTTTGCMPDAICDTAGPQEENQICTVSSMSDNCQAGLICLSDGYEGRCKKFCSSDFDCFGGSSGCVSGIATPTCPTGVTGVSYCTHNCDYFYQSGCDVGQACRFIIPEGSSIAYSECSHAGSGTQGAPCPNGSVDCAIGYDCFIVDGTSQCLQICNYTGGYPSCPFPYTCTQGAGWPYNVGACL